MQPLNTRKIKFKQYFFCITTGNIFLSMQKQKIFTERISHLRDF